MMLMKNKTHGYIIWLGVFLSGSIFSANDEPIVAIIFYFLSIWITLLTYRENNK